VPVAGGDRTKYEWDGFCRKEAEVSIRRRISSVTANQTRVSRRLIPPSISYEWAPGYRYERLRERMAARKKVHSGDFVPLQARLRCRCRGKRLAAVPSGWNDG